MGQRPVPTTAVSDLTDNAKTVIRFLAGHRPSSPHMMIISRSPAAHMPVNGGYVKTVIVIRQTISSFHALMVAMYIQKQKPGDSIAESVDSPTRVQPVIHATHPEVEEINMSRRFISVLIGILCAISAVYAQDVQIKVKYVSADHVYLDKGTANGVFVGDELIVGRKGKKLATIKVVYAATHSANCTILSSTAKIKAGDKAVISRHVARHEQVIKKKKTKRVRKFKKSHFSKRKRRPRISGYLSAQWYQFKDLGSNHLDFQQPTVRIKLYARNFWGGHYNFRIKMRSRHNQRVRSFSSEIPRSEWRNRLYEAAFSYDNPKAAVNYRVGRIISNAFSGVGYIDGLLVQHNVAPVFNWGIFAGTQPQWQYSSFQTSLQKYGAFARYEKGDYQNGRFASTLAFAGEYHGATVSRDFIYLQNNYNSGSKWDIYQSLEMDVNTGWRKDRTGSAISLTGLYINGRYHISKNMSSGLSYDNRKNYYTYELRTLADSLFDDAFRQGVRLSYNYRFAKNYRMYLNGGVRSRSANNDYTYSYMAGLTATNLFNSRITATGRFSGFVNFFTQGYSPYFSLSKYFWGGHLVRLGYGGYFYTINATNNSHLNQHVNLDTQFELPWGLYLGANYEYDWGDDTKGHRLFSDLGIRF